MFYILVTEGFNRQNDIIDIGKSIQTIQVIETNHQDKEWNSYQKVQYMVWSFETLNVYYIIRLNLRKKNTFTSYIQINKDILIHKSKFL